VEKGKRNLPIIHVMGLPGAGKTTLSKKLSAKLKLPVYRIGEYRARHPISVNLLFLKEAGK